MVFKRRDTQSLLSRLRQILYPRAGWRRTLEYLGHRVQRLPDTAHRIALGFSCGVFVSFSPFFGLHFLLAATAAKLVRGNVFAALIGTLAGNPLTFPLIASVSLGIGRRVLGFGATGRDFGRILNAFTQAVWGLWETFLSLFGLGTSQWHKVAAFLRDIVWPYLVGGLLPGLVAAIATYYLLRPLIAAYQSRRRARMAAPRPARPRKSEADGGA